MRRRTLALALLAACGVAAGAALAAPGRWETASKGVVQGSDVVGVGRSPDGVVHVVWLRRGLTASALWETAVGADGHVAGLTPVGGGLANPGAPALAVAPDGTLRAFLFVQAADGTTSNLIAASSAGGSGWSVGAEPLAQVSGSAATPAAAAATARDGTVLVAWSAGPQVRYRYGAGAAATVIPLSAGGCCATGVQAAFDQVSGQGYVTWASSAPGGNGIYVQAAGRSGPGGPRVYATGSATPTRAAAVLPTGRVALTGRLGAPGVYLAYTAGFPRSKRIVLLQAGKRKIALDLRSPGAGDVALVPAPEGRLWLLWSRGRVVYAARTNRTATRIGPVLQVPLRRGSTSVEQLDGNGAGGTLDLIASLGVKGGKAALWYTRVEPRLSLAVTATSAGGTTRYVVRVTDAGEPVANATVRIGKQSLTTGLAGTVTLETSDRPPSASATKIGYATTVAAIS